MADSRPAEDPGLLAKPLTRRERREAERRAAEQALAAAGTPGTAATPPTPPAPDTDPVPAPAIVAEQQAGPKGAALAFEQHPADDTDPGLGFATRATPGLDLGESLPVHQEAPAGAAFAGQDPPDETPADGLPADETAAEGSPDEGSLDDESPVDEPPPAAKGGRNVPVAIAVGLGLGLLVVASLFFWHKEAFLGLAILACGVGLWELARAVRVRDIRLPLLPLLVGTVGIMVSAYTAGVEALLVACVLTSGGAFVWRVLDGGGLPALRDATAAVFATAYIPFLAGFVALMLAADDGSWRVLTFIAVCVANDTGGYVAGVLFGKSRLAPIVSPKKSWEGLIGSYVAACAVGVGMFLGPLDGPWWGGLVLGIVGVTAATLGDLAESLLKRDLGVKDMGTLLPGHGGVLDRIDSVLFTAPVAFMVFYLVLGSGR